MPNFYYPLDMKGQNDRPFIVFTVKPKAGEATESNSIWLPSPPAVQFNDNAQFSSIDLGIMGTVAAGLAKSSDPMDVLRGNVKNLAQTFIGSGTDSIKSTLILANKINPFGAATNAAVGIVANPNARTTFSGITVRQFTFTFKMVATSEDEMRAIDDIHNLLRKYLYPSRPGDSDVSLYLNYPPTWQVSFLFRGTDNPHYPRIFETYLTNVSTTFNSSTVLHHKDGAPTEVDVAVTFQETRPLAREDIEKMKRQGSITSYERSVKAREEGINAIEKAIKELGDQITAVTDNN